MFKILNCEILKKKINIKNIKYLMMVEPISMRTVDESLFRWSCENEQFGLAKWLWEVSQRETKKIDIHADNEYIFREACKYGRLEIVKWLWEVSCKSIDIHAGGEKAFSQACRNGHLEVARWLWEVSCKSIDIHIQNECIFRSVCREGHLEIAKWLWKISVDDSVGQINIYSVNADMFKFMPENVFEWLKSLE